MSGAFDDVQRIVLRGTQWQLARHLLLRFEGGSPLHLLNRLLQRGISIESHRRPGVQISLGFTRRGLKFVDVPGHVLAVLQIGAPAFWAGAALRAPQLGLFGSSAPERWNPSFGFMTLDAVLSLHADDVHEMAKVMRGVRSDLKAAGIAFVKLPFAAALPQPSGVDLSQVDIGLDERVQWVHFGFRDGLARIGIKGLGDEAATERRCLPVSRHAAGEFVLGHVRDSGVDPWVAGPGMRVWPNDVRAFFHNGSFGVLHQIKQGVGAFERFVNRAAAASGLERTDVKGELCGRYPDGRPLAAPQTRRPRDDFDYRDDTEGLRCPFGSHVRRMNPRLDPPGHDGARPDPHIPEEFRLAHFGRSRPLLRRGMPYGPDWKGKPDGHERGMIGHFFCASIEDQFEHLLGEWGDRVPLGSPDRGGARDPFVGAHRESDGPFEIPRPPPGQPLVLPGLRPFVRTRGIAYLFYPGAGTLRRIAQSDFWGAVDRDDE